MNAREVASWVNRIDHVDTDALRDCLLALAERVAVLEATLVAVSEAIAGTALVREVDK